MKACIPWVLACALLTACDLTQPLDVPTPPPGPPTYTVLGTVLDTDDVPVQGATVQAFWNGGRQRLSTLTDTRGSFSIDGMSGEIQLFVSKSGYPSVTQVLQVRSNVTLNVQLKWVFRPVPVGTLPVQTTRLELSKAIRMSTTQPPCDPGGWDGTAPCLAFSFDAPSSGELRVTLTYLGSTEMDMVVVSVKDRLAFAYSQIVSNTEQKLSATLEAGQSYQIWVNSYYESAEFELKATF